MSRLRVLQVIDTLDAWAGGPPQNALELHEALNRRQDVVSELVALHGAAGRAGLLRTSRLMGSSDVVLVHGYYLWWAPVVAAAARVLGRPVADVPHGSLTRHQRRASVPQKRVWELLPGPALRAASTAMVVQSAVERDELLERFPRSRVLIGGIGTPLPTLPAERAAAGDGSADSPVRLLSLSRIAPKKRIDLMIDAVAELQRRGTAARLVVAGSGDAELTADLRRRAEQAGVADRVDFVGMLAGAAKEDAFADAQVFLAPSDDENFGMSPAEALARGVPLIASTAVASAAGLPADAGVVLSAPTGSSVADAVQSLLADDPAVLAAGARAFAAAHYDWDAVAERWADLFRQLGDERRTRRTTALGDRA